MHNSYFFLKRLAESLDKRLCGLEYVEIFSQHKDELIIGLANSNDSIFIKANLEAQFSCLSFPNDFSRARKNSVDLFSELIGKKIDHVQVAKNDRSLKLISGNSTLLFKMYGNRSNIILFKDDKANSLFKQNLKKDYELSLGVDFDRELDLSFEHFKTHIQNLNKFIPTLTKSDIDNIVGFLLTKNKIEEGYNLLMEKTKEFERAPTIINYDLVLPRLQLYSSGQNEVCIHDPIEAINKFYIEYSKTFTVERKRQQLLKEKNADKKKIENYLQKTQKKIEELVDSVVYKQTADIIMANLHAIKKGQSEVKLFDFYNNRERLVRLKKDISPQKNAEIFYRKAKNQEIEIRKLSSNIKEKAKSLKEIQHQIQLILEENNLKHLLKFESSTSIKNIQYLPYHEITIDEFQLLVGKNSRNNDLLTFKVASKNDTWLHVKDAPGSHVVIRQIPGRNIPTTVLEKAASLAAWYSKRKTEGLVPVIYTERKYVRKTRDLLPGQVIVQKENIILAEPKNLLLKD